MNTKIDEKTGNIVEGLSFSDSVDAVQQANKHQSSDGPGIATVDITTNNLPLREYVIKSSFNTAFSGSYLSLSAINYALSRGCRLLDFEIFLIDKVAYVAQANDPTAAAIDSQNKIPLDDVLKYIAVNGFIAPCPNPQDPLFIQLRINPTNSTIYPRVAYSVYSCLNTKMYMDKNGNAIPVTSNTLIGDIMGKIVLIIDKNIASDYTNVLNYPLCNSPIPSKKDDYDVANVGDHCYNLASYVNMESGGNVLRSYTYPALLSQLETPPLVNDDNKTSNVTNMKMVISPIESSNIVNPDSFAFIQKYGVQFVCMRFYKTDSKLYMYEQLFSSLKSACITFAQINALKGRQSDGSNSDTDLVIRELKQ
jgi:hypothetical protein